MIAAPHTSPAMPRLWAVLCDAWLRRQRQRTPEATALLTALALSHGALVGPATQHAQAAAWLASMAARVDDIPRPYQGAVVAWAAVAAWTEQHEADGRAVWARLAEAAAPLAHALEADVGAEVAGAADALRAYAVEVARELRLVLRKVA